MDEPFDNDATTDRGAIDGVTAWMIGEIGVNDASRTRHDALCADQREALEFWRTAFISPGNADLDALVRAAHSIRAALRPIQLDGSEITETTDTGEQTTDDLTRRQVRGANAVSRISYVSV